MEEIMEDELKYLCKINTIKENVEHRKINYYSSLVESIIKNSGLK